MNKKKISKTWVDFVVASEDVEKLEFPVPSSSLTKEIDHNSNQSEVFLRPLGDFNLLDQFQKSMVSQALKLPKPSSLSK